MGLIKNKTFYTYSDVTIMPCEISTIEHRSQCIPFNEDGMLPIFTAPMDTVVNEKNFSKFDEEMINAILPRTVDIEVRISYSINGRWAAYSLKEFEEWFCDKGKHFDELHGIKVLIDVANGHMKKILDLVRAAKNIYGDKIIIMAGNVANPNTYYHYARAGIDYIRISIGTGFGCLSSSNTAIHVPIVSLIDSMVYAKKDVIRENEWRMGKKLSPLYKSVPKIVADGGVRNYSDIIKALALGADYVMVGSVFARMLESAAPKTANSEEWLKLPLYTELEELTDFRLENTGWRAKYNGKEIYLGDITATFYGMASREGQIALNGAKTKTSEGLKKILQVLYTMHGWTENFIDYLRSAMSYVGTKTLDEFRKNSSVIINSQNSVCAVNK